MATVTKDFRIKSGLVVEGATGTINGEDIITTGSTTDDLAEGSTNQYYTESRAKTDAAELLTGATLTNITITGNGSGLTITAENGGIQDLTGFDTDDLSEGATNLYFTNSRALAATASAYDPAGSAATAESNANAYTDTAIGNISSTLNISSDSGTDSITLGSETLTFTGGAGIDTSISSNAVTVAVDAGSGIELTSEGVSVKTNGTLEVDGNNNLGVNVGNGLTTNFNTDLSVDVTYIAQNIILGGGNPSGLETEGPSSQLRVKAGDGIELTSEGVSVNTGYGLEIDGQGQLAVNNGYGISTFNQDVAVDLMTISGDLVGFGLEQQMNKIGVKAGNGINVSANSGSSVEIALANESGLQFNNGDLKVHAGSYITLDSGGVSVNKNSIAADIVGPGLSWNPMLPSMSDPRVMVKTDDSTIMIDGNDAISVNYGNGLTVESSELVVDTSVIASRSYVDSVISGLTWKSAVNLLASSNVDLSAAHGTLVIDGHAALDGSDAGYRLLLTGQTDPTENGIYEYTAPGMPGLTPYELVRASDSDTYQELVGAAVFVMEGTTYGSTSWVQSNHYLSDFSNQEWDQFAGQGSYTAGNGLEINGNEFAIDDTVVVTHTDLEGYLNSTSGSEGTTILYVQDYVATAIETGDATATPTYLAVDINSIATQVASTYTTTGGSAEVAYEFDDTFRSAKFLVKLARGTHTEISEVLVTLDTADNIAITEYAVVGTNGSLGTISATYDGINEKVQLTVDTPSATTVKVAGTLLA